MSLSALFITLLIEISTLLSRSTSSCALFLVRPIVVSLEFTLTRINVSASASRLIRGLTLFLNFFRILNLRLLFFLINLNFFIRLALFIIFCNLEQIRIIFKKRLFLFSLLINWFLNCTRFVISYLSLIIFAWGQYLLMGLVHFFILIHNWFVSFIVCVLNSRFYKSFFQNFRVVYTQNSSSGSDCRVEIASCSSLFPSYRWSINSLSNVQANQLTRKFIFDTKIAFFNRFRNIRLVFLQHLNHIIVNQLTFSVRNFLLMNHNLWRLFNHNGSIVFIYHIFIGMPYFRQ